MNKAKEISALWSEIKPQIGKLVSLCHEVECHAEVAADAYQRGYENGFIAGHLKAEKSGQSFYEDGYQRGLNDAREGKASCQYCKHTDKGEDEEPCASCAFNHHIMFEPEDEKGSWILSEACARDKDTVLTCSKCGYTMRIKTGETPALNFCPQCGDNKNPSESKEES